MCTIHIKKERENSMKSKLKIPQFLKLITTISDSTRMTLQREESISMEEVSWQVDESGKFSPREEAEPTD